ncbi:hypothetical protein IEQ34_015250 [Dendrobium chrysotoxum]|uniref:Uncharacterized protein n=1 Tax=Dendrobium chrysotoxum TaxID=161865 RepID=A0AAV7GHL6_DENCH|nr:hypothetical protein IEQ34_015250 [Dendrobium chrysotoxum]
MATSYSLLSCYILLNLFFFLHLIEKNSLASARELVVYHQVHHIDDKDNLQEFEISVEEFPGSEPYPDTAQSFFPVAQSFFPDWSDPQMGPSPHWLHQSSGRQTPPASTHLATR